MCRYAVKYTTSLTSSLNDEWIRLYVGRHRSASRLPILAHRNTIVSIRVSILFSLARLIQYANRVSCSMWMRMRIQEASDSIQYMYLCATVSYSTLTIAHRHTNAFWSLCELRRNNCIETNTRSVRVVNSVSDERYTKTRMHCAHRVEHVYIFLDSFLLLLSRLEKKIVVWKRRASQSTGFVSCVCACEESKSSSNT